MRNILTFFILFFGFRTFQCDVLVLEEMKMSLASEGNSRNGLKLGGNLQKLGTFYTSSGSF